jgi:hypothetical protein
VVNTGDMMQRYTNGLYQSNLHRGARGGRQGWAAPGVAAEGSAHTSTPGHCAGPLNLTPPRFPVPAVVNLTGRERHSLAFFYEPDADGAVECLAACCSPSNPPQYPPVAGGYGAYLAAKYVATGEGNAHGDEQASQGGSGNKAQP